MVTLDTLLGNLVNQLFGEAGSPQFANLANPANPQSWSALLGLGVIGSYAPSTECTPPVD